MAELRHLRTFLAVAEHRGFRRAAGQIFVSQPAVSRQVNELERFLGVDLVDRRLGPVTLTAAGVLFADRAQRLLDDFDAAVRAAGAERFTGNLVLAVAPGGVAELTDPLMRHLARAFPAVTIRTTGLPVTDWSLTPPPGVDAMLVRDPIPEHLVRVSTLVTEPVRLAVPPTSAVAEAEVLCLDDALAVPLVRPSQRLAPALIDFWTLGQARHGDCRFVGEEVSNPGSVAVAVASGVGAAIATSTIARIWCGGKPLIPITGAPSARIALTSSLNDRRPLIEAVHREAEWVARRIGPLVLPELAEPMPI